MNDVLNTAAREALASGKLAHLVTVNADGSPQATIVWVGLEGEDIVFAHLGSGQKLRNLQRDPRVALTMETGGRNEMGLDHYLIIYGSARVVPGGAPELLQGLAHVYLGPDVRFPPMDNPPAGHVVHITPERVGGIGPWTSVSP